MRDLKPGDTVRWHDGTKRTLLAKRFLDGSDGGEVVYINGARGAADIKSTICLEMQFNNAVERCHPSSTARLIHAGWG